MKKYRMRSALLAGRLWKGPLLSTLIIALLLLLFILGCELLSQGNSRHEEDILKTALDRDITACYALEGHYPQSVDYLKEHYNLTYNEERFLIDYTVTGSNLRPSYLIIERKGSRA